MKTLKIVTGLLAAGVMAEAHAGPVVLSEGFDNVAALTAAGWIFTNASSPPGQSWFQGNSGIFGAQAGAANAYAGANFNSTTAASGVVDNWLISPELSLSGGAILSFFTRAEADGYLDLLEVRFGNGASSTLSNFTTLLETVGDGGSYAVDWTEYVLNLPSATSGRFAFRYSVGDAFDANYIGIDSVTVTAIPEPASLLLLALGLSAACGFQRRQAPAATQPSA